MLGVIATPKVDSTQGLEELLVYAREVLRGQWGRRDERAQVKVDSSLTLSTILTERPFYGDYRQLWFQGATKFGSENWQLHLITRGKNDHFISISRYEGLRYNELFISTPVDEWNVSTEYLTLASSLYKLSKPWYAFVDTSENLPKRKMYESGGLPLFWANWYSPELMRVIGGETFLKEAPVYQVKSLPDGGVYLQATSSLSDHLVHGWSREIKRYFHGKRVQFANYGTAKS